VRLDNPQNPSALAQTVVIVPSGARVLQDHINRACDTTTTVYWRERDPLCFGKKLDSQDDEECLRGAVSTSPLARGEGLWLTTELLVCGACPLHGLSFA
jgi:hypothetical protein